MPPAEKHAKTPSLKLWAVLLVLLLLGIALFGDKGILRAMQYGRQRTELQEELRQLEAANAALRREIESLRSDHRYIETIARRELGMVKADELVYQFPAEEGKAAPPP